MPFARSSSAMSTIVRPRSTSIMSLDVYPTAESAAVGANGERSAAVPRRIPHGGKRRDNRASRRAGVAGDIEKRRAPLGDLFQRELRADMNDTLGTAAGERGEDTHWPVEVIHRHVLLCIGEK